MSAYYNVIGVSSPGKLLDDVIVSEGIETIPVSMTRKITPLQDIKAIISLYKIFKKEKPEIVHTHTPKAGLVGMIAARLAGVNIRLHTVAGLPLVEAKGLKRLVFDNIEKLTYLCSHKIYPNSKGQFNFIIDEGLAKPNKLKVIGNGSSNGIDTSHFDPNNYSNELIKEHKEKWGILENDFVFVFIGRLVKDKGINELVEAFKRVHESHKKTKLLLVGKYEEHLNPLETNTKELIKLHPNIIATGYQTDVRLFFAMSDCLSFPSYREGFPNVVMQAQSMNLPAIVTNINGCNEIITNHKTGIIISIKNVIELTDAMNLMITDQKLYRECSKNARKNIVDNYERQYIWECLLKEYKLLEKQYLNS